ncbi:MAG: hypothetical protein A3C43_02980 [Candidatus Schekmanbacteria bacterium RIFCSPHIGHO2_02_FULL_38_11]|uniref:Zinc-finger domain-containing protein n=1 Tax=Candidatus Schekmanbacteria bacterium RIFCSPLOWO2_12_FULL_38_15 TaxID=1817883 RepID=A0A1F7SEK9_9BACT|nr:MAG: hypothetical protein A2043_10420 [Candidatus Schekmanbacteria bacterium GWA2_38_9]OGL49474.1 MAG: hypothetical protein A3H37_10240 [Candidatus Schekmanbacteria bacterium RIFCSPLOWO2_02_FULL_38_14]OGL52161.1 MAG: hypothetical protein A3G31_07010 [Candidatus Schekmanbacteria bacterium RIFCSPLOWO2_12_FULL_38_15]OGL53584.1 MAG: hypothetical protein A3C43_02980 [Candidatus Schekmanbacteria bacterium RIFCSPHIGHO2_02_FULL_38_11]
MNCKLVKTKLYYYSADALSRKLQTKIERHLSECPVCRSEFEAIEKALEIAKKLPRESPPAGMWNGVLSKINIGRKMLRRAKGWTGFSGIWEIIRLKPLPAVSVFAIIVLFVSGIYFFTEYRYQTPEKENQSYFNEYISFSAQDPLADKIAINRIMAIKYANERIEK